MAISTITFSKGGSSARVLRKAAAAMERDGVVAFDGLLPLPLLKSIRAHVGRKIAGEPRRVVRDIAGRFTVLMPFEGPFLKTAFYANPRLRALIEAQLGAAHCIGSLEAVVARPGAYRQHQHIDGPVRFDRVVGGRKKAYAGDLSRLPPYAVTLCVPLCDITEENGATAVWPGSHRTALRAKPPGERLLSRRFTMRPMTGPFGRAFLFDYRTFHCGLENRTAEPRPILMFVFTRDWFRDPNLAGVARRVVISPRDYRRVPARLKSLFLLAAPAAA